MTPLRVPPVDSPVHPVDGADVVSLVSRRVLAEEVGVIMSTMELELAAARMGVAVDECQSSPELAVVVGELADAVEAWWTDEAIRARVSSISSPAHADSVRIRVDGVVAELRRMSAELATTDRPFVERRRRCEHLVREARRALLGAAMSVRPGV